VPRPDHGQPLNRFEGMGLGDPAAVWRPREPVANAEEHVLCAGKLQHGFQSLTTYGRLIDAACKHHAGRA
jgi:hypothetical protein